MGNVSYRGMENQIIIEGNLVSYLSKAGEKPEQCLLFLHGWRSQKEVWLPIVNHQITKSPNHSIYALDLPGFGSSPAPKVAWAVGDYAEIVKGFIQKLGLNNVIIIGHSFGGRVGIKLAARHSKLISKLVLVDSAGFVDERTKKRAMELTAKLAKPFFLPKFMQGLRRKIYKYIGADDYVATPWLTETFVKVKNEDLSEEMKKISCPTFLIWGENDTDTPVGFGQRMHALIPNSKFLILKNAGHFGFLDKPEEFVSALFEFIKK